MTTTDDDTAGIAVTETEASTIVTEAGGQDTIEVTLTSEPLTDVVLDISTVVDEVTSNVSTLTFNSGNWNVAQTLTLTGADDQIADGDQTTTLTISVDAGASDSTYAALPDELIAVTTIDDENGWHNPAFPEDVNGDGNLTVGDVRLVFTHVNTFGPGPVDPDGPPGAGYMLDVDDNGNIGLSDLRIVFTQVTSGGSGEGEAEGEGEGERAAIGSLRAAPVEHLWSQLSDSDDEDDWWLPWS